jgi:hypothetical protein
LAFPLPFPFAFFFTGMAVAGQLGHSDQLRREIKGRRLKSLLTDRVATATRIKVKVRMTVSHDRLTSECFEACFGA